MTRYKYGPWDDRYYPIIGSLVGRGLLKYVKGRKGSVALSPTPLGKKTAAEIGSLSDWAVINDRCHAVAAGAAGLNGTTLKNLIYSNLAAPIDRPHRELIK